MYRKSQLFDPTEEDSWKITREKLKELGEKLKVELDPPIER